MLSVVVCSVFNVATLAGLLAGIAAGFVRARGALGTALAHDPWEAVTPQRAARPAAVPAAAA